MVLAQDWRHLRVHGCVVATVSRASPFEYAFEEIKGRHPAAAVMDMIQSIDPEVSLSKLRLFGRALFLGLFQEAYEPPDWALPTADEITGILLAISSNKLSTLSYGELHFLDQMAARCAGRALFQTTTGLIGLGPRKIQIGDAVTVLLGCETLMILRSSLEGRFSVVGDAYCETFMAGEALLGPLPGNWKQCYAIPDGITLFTSFRNLDTNKVRFEDPRLRDIDLPAGWVPGRDKEGLPYYWNSATEEERDYDHDPRCDVTELEKRGVQLKELILV